MYDRAAPSVIVLYKDNAFVLYRNCAFFEVFHPMS